MNDSGGLHTEKPYSPYFILGAAIVLPGMGHVLNGTPQRGLTFLLFIIVLAWATSKIAPPPGQFPRTLCRRPVHLRPVDP